MLPPHDHRVGDACRLETPSLRRCHDDLESRALLRDLVRDELVAEVVGVDLWIWQRPCDGAEGACDVEVRVLAVCLAYVATPSRDPGRGFESVEEAGGLVVLVVVVVSE